MDIEKILREGNIETKLDEIEGREEQYRFLVNLGRELVDYQTNTAECVREILEQVKYMKKGLYAREIFKKIDVIAQKDFLIPKLQNLLKSNMDNSDRLHRMKCDGKISSSEQCDREYAELVEEAKLISEPIWGQVIDNNVNIIDKDINKINADIKATKWHQFSKESKLQEERKKLISRRSGLISKRQEGHNVYADEVKPRIIGCIVYGWNTASDTIAPYIRASFLLGHNVLKGRPQYMLNHIPKKQTTKDVDIANSVIFGYSAASDIQGGIIKDSIICGYSPLDRSNLYIQNCYVITPREVKKITKEYLKSKPYLRSKIDHKKTVDIEFNHRNNYHVSIK